MNIQCTKKELRQFGFIMAGMIVLLFVVLFPWIYDLEFSYTPVIISGAFIVAALLVPGLLSPVYRGWIKLSMVLGFINSKILLFIIFYIIIAPMGLVARIFGFDPMRRKRKAGSHYVLRDSDNNDMEKPF